MRKYCVLPGILEKRIGPKPDESMLVLANDASHLFAGYTKDINHNSNLQIKCTVIDEVELLDKEKKFKKEREKSLSVIQASKEQSYAKFEQALKHHGKEKAAAYILMDDPHKPIESHLVQVFQLSDYEQRENLIKKLDNYIARIENHKIQGSDRINVTYGFLFFKNSQAINREANYTLVKHLKAQLENSENSIAEIFTNPLENRSNLAKNLPQFEKNDRGINSKELNKILTEAQKISIDGLTEKSCVKVM